MAPTFPVETRVDGFFEHPSAAPLLASRREIANPGKDVPLKCLSPDQIKESFASSESMLHLTGGIKGLFCGYTDVGKAAVLDAAIGTVFKAADWCCHHNGSLPLAPHGRTKASEPGSVGAGPAEDAVSIGRAKEVWSLTNPEQDKWQARIFGIRLVGAMAVHNHYKCS